jgi:VWFA-related protein
MLIRSISFLLSASILFFVSASAQTKGGGGGRAPAGNPAPLPPSQPPFGSSNNSFPGSVPSHSADDEGKIEFHTETILVQVPIVVTDKAGSHVHGLTKENFRILENGKEQKVATFEEIVSTNTKLPVVTPKPGEFTNLTLSEQTPRAVTVIVLDTVNTPYLDQSTGRRELVKYLASSLDSGQVLALMIITTHGLKIVQGLTGDPEQLLQALKKASQELPAMHGVDTDAQADAAVVDIADVGGPAITATSDPAVVIDAFMERGDAIYAQFQQQNAIETTMNAFLGIAWSLSGVPGRKSVIWATGGFPFTITSPSAVPGGYLSNLYERTMAALTAAQISVYPVDVRGLVANAVPDASKSRVPTGSAAMQQITNRAWLQTSSIETLNQFADMTGGKAFYNTNDLVSSFKRAADDSSSYYLAGYYLDKSNNHAGWRQLKVKVDKVDKKDTEVRARKGFFVTNATIHLDLTRTSDLTYALTSPIEGTGVPMTMRWLGTSGDGAKKRTDYLLNVPLNSVTIQAEEGKNRLNFDVASAVFLDNGKKGEPAITSSKTVSANLAEAQIANLRTNGIAMKDTLELAPGQYTVRVVIRDNVTGKIGSVTAPLTVN